MITIHYPVLPIGYPAG